MTAHLLTPSVLCILHLFLHAVITSSRTSSDGGKEADLSDLTYLNFTLLTFFIYFFLFYIHCSICTACY